MEILTNRDEDSFVSVDGFQNGHQNNSNNNSQVSVTSNPSAKRNLSPSAYDENSNSKRSHQDTSSRRDRSRSRSNDRRRRDRSRSPRRNDRSRDRRDSRRGTDRPSRHSDKYKWERTCYVSNIPYDIRWTDLKDLFRDECKLEPLYCEVYERDGKSLGIATIEFRSESDAEKVVEKMHHHELGGRKISVRIDQEGFKTRQARDLAGDGYLSGSSKSAPVSNVNTDSAAAAALLASTLASSLTGAAGPNLLNLLGMATPAPAPAPPLPSSNSQSNLLNQLASQLKVEGPVTNRLFVASLDYRADEAKIREVFGLAGHVTSVSLFKDRDNRSRGMAVIEYDSSFEALNAVSMFNNQVLMDRKMTVRFDTKPGDEPSYKDKNSLSNSSASKLPSGLKSIGNALGLNLLGNSPSAANTVTNNPLTLGALTALTGLGGGLSAGLGAGLTSSADSSFNSAGLGLLGNFANSQSTSQSSQSSNTISKIFVKNIPFSWDERRLREKFRQAGSIEYVDIKMRDGKSRGCGMIRFTSPQQAQKAVELFNGSRFEGRTLEVKLDTF